LATNPLAQALSHLAFGIDLWHNGGEGLDSAMALEAGNIEMDGHRASVARHVAHEQRLILMDDDLACRAARRALAGYRLGPGADMILRCRFPKIDDIKAGKVQDIDWHSGRRKGRILALLTSIP